MTLMERPRAILSRLVDLARDRGTWSVLGDCVRWAALWVVGRPRAGRPSMSTFGWDGRQVHYLHHRYNYTWLNERAVETALTLEVLNAHAGRDILEIGNVMSHYGPVAHRVVDKYEHAPGVLNADVAELALEERFDLIVAVSTLEHVGLDEEVLDPLKPGRAIGRLKALLKPGGRLWVTHPVGYNTDLDQQLRAKEIEFTRVRALVREDTRNRWRQVPVEQVWEARYDRLLYTAHGLVVAEYVAPE